jgi:hypothetical protein
MSSSSNLGPSGLPSKNTLVIAHHTDTHSYTTYILYLSSLPHNVPPPPISLSVCSNCPLLLVPAVLPCCCFGSHCASLLKTLKSGADCD